MASFFREKRVAMFVLNKRYCPEKKILFQLWN